ncbi:YceI family protein [Emticicia sp. 17c]|uniref:YceI family protein n=1 Tax=Emticicia sp. 17c TaxID=3127704 RepID=UPI00301E5074
MKKLSLFLLFLATQAFTQTKTADLTFKLLPDKSQIIWQGSPVVGGGHQGTMIVSAGNLITFPDGKVKGGNFIIDMNSIVNTDIKDEKGRKNLADHLKSEDFFDTKRFPVANFAITKVIASAKPNEYTVTGNLTLRGSTNAIVFPATIYQDKTQIKAQGRISIDRTRWGVTYKAYNFLSQMKENMISNEIKIAVDLVFAKQ